MTTKEIQERQAEINTRLNAIEQIATRAKTEKVDEDLDKLTIETENLIEEKRKLDAEMLAIRSSVSEFKPIIKEEENEKKEFRTMKNIYSSVEYREAFQDYILSGNNSKVKEIMKRADAVTVTSDVQSVIVPTTITSQLFKSFKNAGALYDAVTKTAYTAGMNIKTLNADLEIDWVAERTTSDKKKATTGYVTFSAFKGLIKFAESFETSVEALPEFEQAVYEKMREGMRKSFDKAIVNGTGVGQPKGILSESIYTTQSVIMTNKNVATYKAWNDAIGKIPMDKKGSVTLVMNEVDWNANILGMIDGNGKPIAVEDILDGETRRKFMGHPVILLEKQGLPTFEAVTGSSTASKSNAFAFFADLKDYWLNMNKNVQIKDYIDEDTDDRVKKLILLADGKMIDTSSILVICKGATV